MTTAAAVAGLFLYPIKSCGAVAVPAAMAGRRGLDVDGVRDRGWMLMDRDGQMITQRQRPELARVRVTLQDGGLQLTADSLPVLHIDPTEVTGPPAVVRLHGQSVPGHLSPDPVNDWFSRLLGAPAWLLYQSDSDQRLCDADFAIVPGADQVGYADAFPFLLTAQATLDQLNLGLPAPLPMDRFRPNIVVRGTTPDAEYGWREISIGGAGLSIVKPCTRCVVTTIDQRSGRKDGVEPLAALGRDYFLRAQMGNALVQGAVFGENAIASRPGEIRVGDPVRLLSAKTPHIFGRDRVAER